MKKVTTLIIGFFFVFSALAQENINWVTVDQLKKEIKKENSNYFIVIENDFKNSKQSEEVRKKINKRMFSYFEDSELASYLNEHFTCFKFNVNTESIEFNGTTYKKIEDEKRGVISHEFIEFLSSGEKVGSFPGIILKDQKFNLFNYRRSKANIEELTILLESEKLKTNYIVENLDENNQLVKVAQRDLEIKEKRLAEAKKNKTVASIFNLRSQGKRLFSTLQFFINKDYEKIDFKTYMNKNE